MSSSSSKYFYTTDSWNEASWIEVVSIEYESLVSAYPFDRVLTEVSAGGTLKILDVGCGSAIFPQFLDRSISSDLALHCDLLDISERSLQRAAMVMGELGRFTASEIIQTAIEDIPEALSAADPQYDVIWAIHSFTTVDVQRMPAVMDHLLRLMKPNARFFIYQLAADSSYQTLHKIYRQTFADEPPRFMESEDSQRILDSLSIDYELMELRFDHVLPGDHSELLENYLRKCVLDDSVDPERVFGDVLPRYKDNGDYRVPQHVDFIDITHP